MEVEQPDWLQQIEGVLESLNEGVLISDDCQNIIFVNSNLKEMTGMTSNEIVGWDVYKLYAREEADFIVAERERGLQVGKNRFEFVLPRRDGSRLPVIISARVVEDPDGRQFSIVTFTDISELKRAEQELREVNKKLEERHQEIQEDLKLAARVQQSLAPKSLVWGGVRVETFYHPVRTIGGDFGLVSSLDDHYLNLLVCDVSGHGISSALVANRIYTEAISQIEGGARRHMTQSTRTLLARFFKVHPGFLVDDPEGYHTELVSDLRTTEGKLDVWLLQGSERFASDPQVSEVLIKAAREKDTRRCFLLLGAILETPGLADRLLEALQPEHGGNRTHNKPRRRRP